MMKSTQDSLSRSVSPLSAAQPFTCPACGGALKVDSKWCPSCNFTGADSLDKFPESPPPLQPILDAVGLWNPSDLQKVEAARKKLSQRFPQIHWRVCNVALPSQSQLSLFGFWLLNTCPLADNETPEQRAWTILLLIDVAAQQVTVVPGYAAEKCLREAEWLKILQQISVPWQAGETANAVIAFFKNSQAALELAHKGHKIRRSK